MSQISNSHLAFIFPGQGSQSVGMLSELAEKYSEVQKTYAQASEILNYDLWALTQKGPEEVLNETEKTQPALLAGSIAIWRIWQSQQGALPVLLAGHSLGEYSALVCASALKFEDAIQLVADRGRFMQEAVPQGQGAMAVIVGLEDQQVEKICQEAAQKEVVTPANYNAIGQVAIAGNTDAVKRAIELAQQQGAKMAKLIPVSVPSHCELMKPAANRLADRLISIEINIPKIPVIQNAAVCSFEDVSKIRETLIQQLYSPVHWVRTIEFFVKKDITQAVECGAGKVLAGLNKRITDKLQTVSISTPEKLQEALKCRGDLE